MIDKKKKIIGGCILVGLSLLGSILAIKGPDNTEPTFEPCKIQKVVSSEDIGAIKNIQYVSSTDVIGNRYSVDSVTHVTTIVITEKVSVSIGKQVLLPLGKEASLATDNCQEIWLWVPGEKYMYKIAERSGGK